MTIWSCDQEVCGVCVFWAGKRDMEFNGFFCEVSEPGGECLCPYGGTRGLIMLEGASCRDWKGFIQVEPIS